MLTNSRINNKSLSPSTIVENGDQISPPGEVSLGFHRLDGRLTCGAFQKLFVENEVFDSTWQQGFLLNFLWILRTLQW